MYFVNTVKYVIFFSDLVVHLIQNPFHSINGH